MEGAEVKWNDEVVANSRSHSEDGRTEDRLYTYQNESIAQHRMD